MIKANLRETAALMRESKRLTVYEARMEGDLPDKIRKLALSGFGISLIAGIILAILGPYQTASIPFSLRLIYWTGLTFVGGLGANAFSPMTQKLGITSPRWLTILGQSLTATIAVTACLVGLDIYRSGGVKIIDVLLLLGLVWVISIVIASIAHLAEDANAQNDTIKESHPAIFARLKPALRNSVLYALSAEDHYVRAFTSKGEDLILMRLGDAIKESHPLPGLSVHRSWWIAETGVKSVKKSDGKLSVELPGGQFAPVSRSNAKSVREAGWV